MYFVITSELKDGNREHNVEILDDYAKVVVSLIKNIRDGYAQYSIYKFFTENPKAEPAKRLILAEGSTIFDE